MGGISGRRVLSISQLCRANAGGNRTPAGRGTGADVQYIQRNRCKCLHRFKRLLFATGFGGYDRQDARPIFSVAGGDSDQRSKRDNARIKHTMTGTQKSALFWVTLIGGGGLVLYYLSKKAASAVGSAVSTAATDVGQTVASPFEWLYSAVTGNTPMQTFDTTGGSGTYFVYDANGNLTYDANNNLVLSQYPPGTPQNPNPNPHG